MPEILLRGRARRARTVELDLQRAVRLLREGDLALAGDRGLVAALDLAVLDLHRVALVEAGHKVEVVPEPAPL